MWHSLGSILGALDTLASCAPSDSSLGRFFGTVGIPQWKNHTAAGGPAEGQKRGFIFQTRTFISSIFMRKHSARQRNHKPSFMQGNPYTLMLTLPTACYCPTIKVRISCIQSFKKALSKNSVLYLSF